MAELDTRFLERRPLAKSILACNYNRGAVDISDNPLSLVSSGTVTLNGVGNGCTYNTGTHYVSNTSKLQPTGGAITLAASVRYNAYFTNFAFHSIIDRYGQYFMRTYRRDSNFELVFGAYNAYANEGSVWCNFSFPLSTWAHIVCTFDVSWSKPAWYNSDRFRVYKDGVKQYPNVSIADFWTASVFASGSGQLNIGNRPGYEQQANCSLKNVLILDRSVTDAEAKELFNNWKT